MPSTKKQTKKSKDVETKSNESGTESEHEEPNVEKQEQPEKVNHDDEHDEQKHPTFETTVQATVQSTEGKSIIEFDHDAIRKLDIGTIKLTDNMTLLKILIVRGKDEHNPSLWAGTQRLLRQLNCEFERKPNFERRGGNDGGNFRKNFSGGRERTNFEHRPYQERPNFEHRPYQDRDNTPRQFRDPREQHSGNTDDITQSQRTNFVRRPRFDDRHDSIH